MASSFDFLQDKWPVLSKIALLAESYLYSDPNATIYKMGQFAEQLTIDVCKMEGFQDFPTSQNDRIRMLKREDLIDDRITAILHSIRRSRNDSVHELKDDIDEAIGVLKLSYRLAEWLESVYNDWNYQSRPYQVPVKVILPNYEEIIAKQNAELEELKKQSEKLAVKKIKTNKADRIKQSMSFAEQMELTESETRQLIDAQLRQVGWEVDTQELRYSKGTRPQKNKNMLIAEWPTDAKSKTGGFVDYAMFLGTKLVGFIEAKRASKNVSSVLDDQAKPYSAYVRAQDQDYTIGKWRKYHVPFVFATNGRKFNQQIPEASGIWFEDLREPDNSPKPLQGWMSPENVKEALRKNIDESNKQLLADPKNYLKDPDGLNLRYYQLEAIEAANKAVVNGQKNILLTMATGTGKTRTMLGLLYSLLKSKRFNRILYLVDRNSLGKQTADTFSDVRIESFQSLCNIYDVKTLSDGPSWEPDTKVQIATVQSMIQKIDGSRDEMPGVNDFDLIVVDEAHRGYLLDREMTDAQMYTIPQEKYLSKYRQVLDYFQAVKIGMTATPALHTTEIFGKPIYSYTYRQAVLDGYLVDHDAPHLIKTKKSSEGIQYEKGDAIPVYDPNTGEITNMEVLEDELKFDVEQFNRKIRTPGFTTTVLEEISQYLDPSSDEKTLIFAASDAHADEIVQVLKDIYSAQGIDTDAIAKITGSSCNGNQKKIQELIDSYRLEEYPNIVVTVDLLTTGVDIPSICNLVFMRPLKSRILYEQMLGRATRLCPEIKKDHFNIFDAIGITDLLSDITNMKPVTANPRETIKEAIEQLSYMDTDTDKKKKLTQIIAKLERKAKIIDQESLDVFEYKVGRPLDSFIQLIRELPSEEAIKQVKENVDGLSGLDRIKPKPKRRGVIIDDTPDELVSHTQEYSGGTSAEDYLEEFNKYVNENKDKIGVLKMICTRPSDLRLADLKALKMELENHQFTTLQLNSARTSITGEEAVYDLIAFIRNQALGSNMITHEQRVRDAIAKLKKSHSFTQVQKKWLDRIENTLINEDQVLNKEMFNSGSFLSNGGFKRIDKAFGEQLNSYIAELNSYMYDDGGLKA